MPFPYIFPFDFEGGKAYSFTTGLGLKSTKTSKSRIKRIFNPLFGLKGVKGTLPIIERVFRPLLGIKSTQTSKSRLKRIFKPLLGIKGGSLWNKVGIRTILSFKPLLGLKSSEVHTYISHQTGTVTSLVFTAKLGLKRLLNYTRKVASTGKYQRHYFIEPSLGINLPSPIINTDAGGTTVGSRLYWSSGTGAGEVWTKETARVKIKIIDAIAGRSRMVSIIISNPSNSKDDIYTVFLRIKILEYMTNQIVFLGRVVSANSEWDPDLGTVLNVTAQDYMYELTQRYVKENFSIPTTLSTMVETIVQSNITPGSILSYVHQATPATTITREYANSKMKATEAIEELAQVDGTYSGVGIDTIGCDYRVTDSLTPVFEYFPRGTRPVGGTTNGMTISLTDTPGNQVKRMLSDYNFSAVAGEFITRVVCKGQDSSGNKLTSLPAVNSTLENTYGIRTEFIDTLYGATTQADLDARAITLLGVYGGVIKRGKCSIFNYPVYQIGSTQYTVRAGDLVHIHNVLQNVDQDYLVVSISYEEPPFITVFELLDVTQKGRELPQPLGTSISASDIGDLFIPSPVLSSASISNLTSGILGGTGIVTGIIGSGGSWKTDSSPSARIEFNNAGLWGYGPLDALQVAWPASDGKIYSQNNKMIIDANGITITQDGIIFRDLDYIERGRVYGDLYTLSFIIQGEGNIHIKPNHSGSGAKYITLYGDVSVDTTNSRSLGYDSYFNAFYAGYINRVYASTRLKIPVGTNMYD